MKPTFFLLIFSPLWMIQFPVFAQDTTGIHDFEPGGDAIIKVFANVHGGMTPHDHSSAFEIRRAYLGYEYDLSRNFYTQVKLDIGSPDDISDFSRIRRYAYFKNAMIRYTTGRLAVDFGLIDMQHFKHQEKFWGYRYIERSYNDRFRLGQSADIGIDAIYGFADWFSVDFTLTNGEGYTNLQRDNTFKGGLGMTVFPLRGLSVRVYGDLMSKSVNEMTVSTFIGYAYEDKARLGFEYNYKFNDDYVENHDFFGYSIYGAVKLPYRLEVFGRYDWLSSNIPEGDVRPWHLSSDGSSVIAGIQYEVIRQVKIALDYQDWYPRASNETNAAYIFLNVEFKY